MKKATKSKEAKNKKLINQFLMYVSSNTDSINDNFITYTEDEQYYVIKFSGNILKHQFKQLNKLDFFVYSWNENLILIIYK